MEDKKAYNPEEIIIGRNAVNEALRKGEANREETMNKMAPGMGGMGGMY